MSTRKHIDGCLCPYCKNIRKEKTMTKDKEYNFEGSITVSARTKVMANSYGEALEIASKREATINWGNLCNAEELWIVDDADGKAFDIEPCR